MSPWIIETHMSARREREGMAFRERVWDLEFGIFFFFVTWREVLERIDCGMCVLPKLIATTLFL